MFEFIKLLLRPAKHKNRLNKDQVTLPILISVRNPLLVCELNFYSIELRVGVCFPEYIYCRFLEAHFIYLSEILIWSHSEQNWARGRVARLRRLHSTKYPPNRRYSTVSLFVIDPSKHISTFCLTLAFQIEQ